jgi:carbamoyl-phosphate synthase large subunit
VPQSQLVNNRGRSGAGIRPARIGYPVILRPSVSRWAAAGGGIAYNREELRRACWIAALRHFARARSPHRGQAVLGWKEFELEVMRDRADNAIIVCSIENFDPDGRAHGRLHHRGAGP